MQAPRLSRTFSLFRRLFEIKRFFVKEIESNITNGLKTKLYIDSFQHHWNNPQMKSNQVDSSGMVFHLTPKLRPNNAGVLMIGQYNLEIPPGTLGYSAIGSCHGDCTEQIMDGPIYISTVMNHMHLLGKLQ